MSTETWIDAANWATTPADLARQKTQKELADREEARMAEHGSTDPPETATSRVEPKKSRLTTTKVLLPSPKKPWWQDRCPHCNSTNSKYTESPHWLTHFEIRQPMWCQNCEKCWSVTYTTTAESVHRS